jgi:branched-chain amino acid transport system permease protein
MRFIFKTDYDQDICLFQHGGQVFWYGLLGVLLLAAPFMVSGYVLSQLQFICIYSIVGLGLMLLTGYTGQISLGHAAFLATGAYTEALLQAAGMPFIVSIISAALFSAAVGIIVGLPALRLKGIYLAMATVGFGEMVRSFFLNFDTMGGSSGYHGMKHISVGYIWAWIAGILIVVMLMERSRVWLEMQAVHDDETAAGLIGLNTIVTKVSAFSVGAAVAAISGGLFAHNTVYIEPANFGFDRSVDFVLAVILGGSTVGLGSLIGALLLVFLPEFLRPIADWRLAAFGALLVLVLLVRRQGILDRALIRKLTFRRTAA